MTRTIPSVVLTTILPCNDLDISKGGFLHLTMATQGWLVPGKNPFGLYLYADDVDAVAAGFGAGPAA